jgi:hypothetical protein
MPARAAGAWEPLPDAIAAQAMDAFQTKYAFDPGMEPSSWPSLAEPAPSITLNISSVGSGGGLTIPQADELILRLLVAAFPPATRLVAINYNHYAYWLWPHRLAAADRSWPDSWPVHPYPNGDYSIFASEDLAAGTFGHPWERSLCIFGASPIASVRALPASWPVLRARGKARA